jgi:hypothetical protein
MKRKISMSITFEQLIDALKQLSSEELEELELAITREELLKRSKDVKKGEYLKLDEMESLKNV